MSSAPRTLPTAEQRTPGTFLVSRSVDMCHGRHLPVHCCRRIQGYHLQYVCIINVMICDAQKHVLDPKASHGAKEHARDVLDDYKKQGDLNDPDFVPEI